MPKEPKHVIAARKLVEDAEEQTRLEKEVSATPNTDDQKPVEPVATKAEPAAVIPPVVDKNVLNWEEEYNTLHEKHGKLESRFNVMKGKYDSEVPILHGEIRMLKAENESLKARGESEETPGEATDSSIDNIRQLYGQELVDYLASQNKDSANKIKELESKVSRFDESQRNKAEDAFYEALTKAHPNWKALNTTNAFLGFLNEYLPSVGMTRQEIVDNAGKVGNPEPIISQLTAFKKHTADGSSINSQVVPEEGGASPIPIEGGNKRVINESEVAAFYKKMGIEISQGKNPTATDEYKRLDQEYSDAARDQRIVLGQ